MAFLGIDYGSRAIKAAICDGSQKPSPMALGSLTYIPNLCCYSGNQELKNALPLLQHSFMGKTDGRTLFAENLRDQAKTPFDVAYVDGHSISSVDVHRWPLFALRQALSSRSTTFDGVIVSIPDHWYEAVLALPVAMASAQLFPLALVPESLAAITSEFELERNDSILTLSMGAGMAYASLVNLHADGLSIEHTWKLPGLGGRGIRGLVWEKVVQQFASPSQATIQKNSGAFRDLTMWVNACVESLSKGRSYKEPLVLNGNTQLSRSFSAVEIHRMLSKDQLEQWVELFDTLLTLPNTPTRMLAWGETSFLVKPLLSEVSQRLPLQLASLECVARGCANLARDLSTGLRGYFENDTPVLRTSDGGRTMRADLTSDVVPILHPLHCPATLLRRRMRGILRSVDQNGSQIFVSDKPIRIGRDERSEIVIDSHRFPMVSSAHALVANHGQEFVLRDLGSRNGTFLNGIQVEEAKLKTGDRIRLGLKGPEFLFQVDSGNA